MMANIIFPEYWQPGMPISLDGALFAHILETFLESSPVKVSTLRMYQYDGGYPADLPLNLVNALAALNGGGHGMVYYNGRASRNWIQIGSESFVIDHAINLLNAPNGGAAAFLGSSVPAFPSAVHRLNRVFFEETYTATPIRLGEAADRTRTRYLDETYANLVMRWTVLSQVLLGDPALRLGPVPPFGGAVGTPPAAVATRLLRAAPNPFNPTTTLTFDLAQAGAVQLEVYAVDGRRVATLVSGERSAGRHTAVWRGMDDADRSVGSGVYLVRLRHAGGIEAQRLVLVR